MKHRFSIGIIVVSISIIALVGCSVSPQPHETPAATFIYVAQNNSTAAPPQVLQFPANSTGNPSPSSTITFAASATITAIAVDASGNLYVASTTDLREYAAGSSGTATPIRLIPANATTTLGSVTSLAVDASGNIYAAEVNDSADTCGIAVFSSTANGSVAPTRYIVGGSQAGGNLSTLKTPAALATDSSGNLYVLDSAPTSLDLTTIDVFSSTATGNVAPIRTIGGALVGYVRSIAIDSADNLYTTNNLDAGSIYVYSNGASGNATPTRSITQIGFLDGLTVDLAANVYTIYAGSMLNNVLGPLEIITFSPSASGMTSPKSKFFPGSWTSGSVLQVAVN
jgi:hypothetical protein